MNEWILWIVEPLILELKSMVELTHREFNGTPSCQPGSLGIYVAWLFANQLYVFLLCTSFFAVVRMKNVTKPKMLKTLCSSRGLKSDDLLFKTNSLPFLTSLRKYNTLHYSLFFRNILWLPLGRFEYKSNITLLFEFKYTSILHLDLLVV